MASAKIEKGSEEWQVFMDYWQFIQKYYSPDNDDSWWDEVVKAGESLINKYKGMERLTKRTADGILVKENYEKKSLKTLYSCYGEKPNSYYSNCEEGYCAMEKLADYEDAEEQRLLLRLPCGIGSDVYIIPSKINYELNILSLHPENNKVYHQKVALITFTEKGWYMECDKDREYATDRILSEKMYKETWFLSKEEAEAKLKEMRGGENG